MAGKKWRLKRIWSSFFCPAFFCWPVRGIRLIRNLSLEQAHDEGVNLSPNVAGFVGLQVAIPVQYRQEEEQ
jgi:hypothetical protein